MQTIRSDNHTTPSFTSTRLNSWKEIAAFFDKDVRTVRRWEVERKMPVYRAPGGPRSGVYAYAHELERWLRNDNGPFSFEREMDIVEIVEEAQPVAPLLPGVADPSKILTLPVTAPVKVPLWTATPLKMVFGIAFCLVFFWLLQARFPTSRPFKVIKHAGSSEAGKAAEAQDLYIRARYFWNLRTEEGLNQALELFQRASDRDPHFAAAYAGIADSYILIRQYGHMPDSEAFPRALEASQKALELDATSFEAHRSYAFVLNYWLWDFRAAEDEFRKVISLHPEDALAHHWYATSLYSNGRFRDALDQIEIARQLQPESIATLANRDLLLAQLDQQAAFTDLLLLEEANPSFPPIHNYLADIYLTRGETKRYLEESELAASLSGDAKRARIFRNVQGELSRRGPKAALLSLADGFGDLADRDSPDAMTPAFLYIRAGEKQRSLHYLALACHRHESTFLRVGYDKAFEPLTEEAAFQELLRRRYTVLTLEGSSHSPKC